MTDLDCQKNFAQCKKGENRGINEMNLTPFLLSLSLGVELNKWLVSEEDADTALGFPDWLDEVGKDFWGDDEWILQKRVYHSLKTCISPTNYQEQFPGFCPKYGDLLDFVLRDAQPDIRPSSDRKLRLGLAIEPYKVTELDLDIGVIEVVTRVMLSWPDSRLTFLGDQWFPGWDSLKDFLVIPSNARGGNRIWLPRLVPYRSVEDNYYEHGNDFMRPRVYDARFLKVLSVHSLVVSNTLL
eukprot:Blabericola_migrator_1__9052@NODE_481_length_8138_cov_55_758146_g374_i0_p4_GENE_NODE_481_length_8138_cov_55_758146_g374_i0NODE_481_length_8138_cov_55_758146_g374_i0_p4_ORF_typecomplete_len240_score38_56Neur_chan_LBD/PF02931_23/0_00088_NODE_481_length_8138_cov_55_758146_g374_i034114130